MMEWNVLIVDDAVAVVEALTHTLERLGLPADQIFSAATPAAAMEIFRGKKPGVVFLDLNLGPARGDDVAKEILEASSATKVIVMTGMDPSDDRVRDVVSAGAFEVLQKPLRLKRVREALELIDSEERGLRRI